MTIFTSRNKEQNPQHLYGMYRLDCGFAGVANSICASAYSIRIVAPLNCNEQTRSGCGLIDDVYQLGYPEE